MTMSYSLEAVFTAYLECALWSSSVEEPYASAHDMAEDTSMDSAGFTVNDIDPESKRKMLDEVNDFLDCCEDLLLEAGVTDEMVGHDFWLTRNGHGAGFWDRGLGEIGDRITELCKPFGESYLYIGDDQSVYVA